MIDNEFMYKFAKRLALDTWELTGRSHVGVVLRCYLPANVSYWLGCVVVRDSDNVGAKADLQTQSANTRFKR